MNAHSLMTLAMTVGGLVVVVAVLRKVGRGLTAVFEALATLATVLIAVWWTGKAVLFVVKSAVTHPRSTASLAVLLLWLMWWGSSVGVMVGGAIVAVAGVGLVAWWWRGRLSYEHWVGGRLRSWWLRWTVYARLLPRWLRACRLTVQDPDSRVVLVVSELPPVARTPRPGLQGEAHSGSPGRRGARRPGAGVGWLAAGVLLLCAPLCGRTRPAPPPGAGGPPSRLDH